MMVSKRRMQDLVFFPSVACKFVDNSESWLISVVEREKCSGTVVI